MTEKRYWYFKDGEYEQIIDEATTKTYYGLNEVVDVLNEQHEDYDKLFKFVVIMNRQINNSIVISDQFKEAWNHVLKKVVGELE